MLVFQYVEKIIAVPLARMYPEIDDEDGDGDDQGHEDDGAHQDEPDAPVLEVGQVRQQQQAQEQAQPVKQVAKTPVVVQTSMYRYIYCS